MEGFSEGGKSRSLTLNCHGYRKCHVEIRMLQIRHNGKTGCDQFCGMSQNLCLLHLAVCQFGENQSCQFSLSDLILGEWMKFVGQECLDFFQK